MVTPPSTPTSTTHNPVAAGSDIPPASDSEVTTASRVSSGPELIGLPSPNDESPFPPRYHWLKRIMLAAVLSILFLLAIRLAWGWHAHRAFERAIAEIKQRGKPIEPEDFDSPEIPDEENAVVFLLKAIDALDLTPEAFEFVDAALGSTVLEFESGEWTRVESDTARRIEARNAEALRLVRTARRAPRAAWGHNFDSPVINVMFPKHSELRQLLKLLNALSMAASQRGDHHNAVQYIRDMLAIAEFLHEEPTLLGHLNARAGVRCATVRVEDALPLIRQFGLDTLPAPDGTRPVTRTDAEELLQALLGESRYVSAGPNKMRFERMLVCDLIRCITSGRAEIQSLNSRLGIVQPSRLEYLLAWPFFPAFFADGHRAIEILSGYVEALASPNWPLAKRWFSGNEVDSKIGDWFIRPMTRAMGTIQGLGYFARLHYEGMTERRMAATAVAIRLFREDHGRRPDTLEELVPKYLPAVPRDPMAEDDAPIRYLPNASPPILYSVSENGVDDGGRYLNDKGELDYNAALDFPYFLDGRPVFEGSDDDASADTDSGQAAPHEDGVEHDQADPGDTQDEDQRPE